MVIRSLFCAHVLSDTTILEFLGLITSIRADFIAVISIIKWSVNGDAITSKTLPKKLNNNIGKKYKHMIINNIINILSIFFVDLLVEPYL